MCLARVSGIQSKKTILKKPIKCVFYSFSRNFFYSSWLDYRLLRFYRLFFTKNAAMMLENQFKILIIYNSYPRYSLNMIKVDISETIYLSLFHIIPKRRNNFRKFVLKLNFLTIQYQTQGAEIMIKLMKIHP